MVADKVKDILGQTVIIENKPGANGAIGADSVAKAPPDGYTLFLSTVGAVAITPNMRTDLPYDVLRDFATVTLVVRNTTVLVVRADSPVKSIKEFVEMAKSRNGDLPFASTGVGSTTHLAEEMFSTVAGFKFVHVPYRGAAPALTDLLGGQVQAFFADVPAVMPQITGGKVRPIAVASNQRNPMLPEVPTLAESRLSKHVVGQLVWPAGAGENAAGDHRQAERGVRRRHQRPGGEGQADQVRRDPGREHPGPVRSVPEGRAGALGQAGA